MEDDEMERRKKRIAVEEQAVRDLKLHMVDEDRRVLRESKWRIGKEIPLALIGVIVMQTIGVVWWAATVSTEIRYEKDARLASSAMQLSVDRRQDDERTASEGRIASRLDKIDAKLERVAEKLTK